MTTPTYNLIELLYATFAYFVIMGGLYFGLMYACSRIFHKKWTDGLGEGVVQVGKTSQGGKK